MTVAREHPAVGINDVSSSVGVPGLAGIRVGLVHDWLYGMRGGEKVLDAICEMFPDASLWTLFAVRGSTNARIEHRAINVSPLHEFPGLRKWYRRYLPLFPLMAELNRVECCDLVISSSHAVAKAMVKRTAGNRPFHICYIHAPMRYIWDRFDDYFGPSKVGRFVSLAMFRPLAMFLRIYDRTTASRVDVFCANSTYVAAQVRRLYKRHAVVVHPPVEVERFSCVARHPEDWYLVVSALVPYKRVDHAIVACSRLGRRLRVVGAGPEGPKLRSLATALGAQVEFLGSITDDELTGCYSRARGLLFPGVEDFGIVPVEALAAGCPVVALGEGGILDTMTDRTGILYTNPTPEGLLEAVVRFEATTFRESELRERSQLFSRERFIESFSNLVAGSYKRTDWQSDLREVAAD